MNIHFIGIGGCGMNGVAQLAAHAGHMVSGSDRAENPDLFQCLEKQGITIFPQDGSGVTKETDFVVYSTAIESNNPDIQQSDLLGIPLLHRAEMLARLCEGKVVIAVAGTAGKSTVTGLLGHIFQCLEKDPTVYCGAPVLNWKNDVAEASSLCDQRQGCRYHSLGNIRFGSGPWIIEADESDKSFLKFYPDHAIITNIAEDHFSIDELHELFEQFESQVSGITIKTPLSFDTPTLLVGKHNLENVNNALTLCKALGLDMHKCIEAVRSFKGIERRLERHGEMVIDDFAHSPIKIAAALEAASEIWQEFNVVWRPHGFGPLFQMQDALCNVFVGQKVFVLPVYYAGGTVEKKITSRQFVDKLQEVGVHAEFVENFQTLEKQLLEEGLPVLIMGARDPELPRFAQRIAAVID